MVADSADHCYIALVADASSKAARAVHHGDGIAFLREQPLPAGHAIVTSLPDTSELPELSFTGWQQWFEDAVAVCCTQVADHDVAIFFQTDIKRDGRWVDKGFLAQKGAERSGSSLLFHKVVCRRTPGQVSFGRPAYVHLLAFSREHRLAVEDSSADVLPRLGEMVWPRAMGVDVCRAVARFLRKETSTSTVVDPFCGQGTMLAVANAHGLDAVGVERSKKRVKKAQQLTLDSDSNA